MGQGNHHYSSSACRGETDLDQSMADQTLESNEDDSGFWVRVSA